MSGADVGDHAIDGANVDQRAAYLDVRLRMKNGDEAGVARALLLIAELDGMNRIASECGLSACSMRRQLDGTRPLYFETVMGVMRALGLQMRAEPRQREGAS